MRLYRAAGQPKKFGALIIGVYREGKLQFAGHVDGEFNQKSLADTIQKLIPLITKTCPFENTLKRVKQKGDFFKPILGRGMNLPKILKLIQKASEDINH